MTLGPIAARCPLCGSADVVYTCNPACCFNHVCGSCRASWQHRTVPIDEPTRHPGGAPGEYDASLPSAPCARCGEPAFQIEGTDRLACPACGGVLGLECVAVQPFSADGSTGG